MKNRKLNLFRWLITRFLLFFCMNGFVITCCFLLFFSKSDISHQHFENGAIMTFVNVIVISVIMLILDVWSVYKPIKQINDGLEKIMKGEFNTHIPSVKKLEDVNQFNLIIDNVNQLATELGSVETLRNDFISNVSHELKTPLAIIKNYSKLLQIENLDDKQRYEYAKNIENTSHRLADLITNVLKLNKLDNQQIYPEIKVYNLSEQVSECLLQFENMWEDKNIDIHINIEDDVYVNADEELLSLVWNNLFSNALKFTDQNGTIVVEVSEENEYVKVIVKDNGCGMSKETGKHIFDKFYQGDTSHATQGNGLGLSLVKKVIDITNGEIFVQSELHVGSIFEIRLPKYINKSEI